MSKVLLRQKHLLNTDVEAAEVETDLHLRAVSGADYTAAESAAEVSLITGA